MYQQWYYHDQEPDATLQACKAMGADSCLFFCWSEEGAMTVLYNEFDEQNLIEGSAELLAEIEVEMRYISEDETLKEDPEIAKLLESCPGGCAGVFWYENDMLVFSYNVDEEKAEQVGSTIQRIIEPTDETIH